MRWPGVAGGGRRCIGGVERQIVAPAPADMHRRTTRAGDGASSAIERPNHARCGPAAARFTLRHAPPAARPGKSSAVVVRGRLFHRATRHDRRIGSGGGAAPTAGSDRGPPNRLGSDHRPSGVTDRTTRTRTGTDPSLASLATTVTKSRPSYGDKVSPLRHRRRAQAARFLSTTAQELVARPRSRYCRDHLEPIVDRIPCRDPTHAGRHGLFRRGAHHGGHDWGDRF